MNHDILLPANETKDIIETLCIYRSESIFFNNLIAANKEWKTTEISIKNIYLKLPRLIILSIDANGTINFDVDNYFNVNNIDNYVPYEIANWKLALDQIYFKEILKQPLPQLQNLTLIQILAVWRFISSMIREVKTQIPELNLISHSQELLQYSPVFSQNNLVSLMCSGFQLTSEQAIKIIELFTFKGKPRDDLWYRPLIKVNEDKLTMIFDSLKSPNLLRCIEKWLEEGWLKKVSYPIY